MHLIQTLFYIYTQDNGFILTEHKEPNISCKNKALHIQTTCSELCLIPIDAILAVVGMCVHGAFMRVWFSYHIPVKIQLANVGIEPTTFALLARRSNQLS